MATRRRGLMDWENRYKTGDMPWEKGAPSPGLVDFLRGHPVKGSVLVPGCGFGHDVRALAGQGARVTGLDIAPSAIHGAQTFPPAGSETYQLEDFFDLPSGMRGTFDWVWEHTCFCAIDPQRRPDYAKSAARALRPGGALLAVFYLDPDNDEDGPPYGVTPAELESLFGAELPLEKSWVPEHTYPGREGRELMQIRRKR